MKFLLSLKLIQPPIIDLQRFWC